MTTVTITTSTTRRLPLTGAYTALITPFRHGELDIPALRTLVERQILGGISGLVPCGTTGETPALTTCEWETVVSTVVETTQGRVPVIAGTGSNGTASTIERTQRARELGADAALVVTPYYNRPTQEGLYQHFAAIANATEMPLVLYNVPGRTSVNMLPETVLRLSTIPGVVAIKEASGSLDQSSQIVGEAPEGFAVLSGDDSLTLPIMGVGGTGVISVVSNIVPEAVSALTGAALAGDYATARTIHHALFDLCRAMFCETNPVPVKAAAALLGYCAPDVRLPLAPLSESAQRRVETALAAWQATTTPQVVAA
ncbi:MAG: 4-hydroxy-tetrahydrodipicolinate synthase [Thermomicrobiales bacterium]|nr:4-hydroxy-tetrahydrodipicolinate synthase [Thermomicrobiales bacterium]